MTYQLHDSQINNISIYNDKIEFYFSKGFWETDTKGKEVYQNQNCKIIFYIENKFNLPIDDFLTIRICKRKNIFKPISLEKFANLLKKTALNVDMEYDCIFANKKMIQLYSNSLKIFIELFIEDIKNIEYIHD